MIIPTEIDIYPWLEDALGAKAYIDTRQRFSGVASLRQKTSKPRKINFDYKRKVAGHRWVAALFYRL
jgi:hypothetical protein